VEAQFPYRGRGAAGVGAGRSEAMNTSLLTRIGALTGAVYVVVAILANDVLGGGAPESTASVHEIGSWWRGHHVTIGDWTLGMLELSALLCFPVFVIVLSWLLHRADDGRTWLPWVVLGFGLMSAVVKIASAAPMFALVWRADNGISDGLAAAMVDMNAAAFVLTWALDAFMLAAAGAIILRTHCLPRWLGWWALATAPLLLINVPVAISGPPFFLLALIWFVATARRSPSAGERMRGPEPAVAPA